MSADTQPLYGIYAKIHSIMEGLKAIEKTQYHDHYKANFRGIDDVMRALHPLLLENRVILSTSVIGHECFEGRASLLMRVMFVDIDDGSSICIEAAGGATGKESMAIAQSNAFKQCILFGLCVPIDRGAIPDSDQAGVDSQSTSPIDYWPKVIEAISGAKTPEEYDEVEARLPEAHLTPENLSSANNMIKQGRELIGV